MNKNLFNRLHRWLVVCATIMMVSMPAEARFYLGVGGYEVCTAENQLTAYRDNCPQAHIPVTDLLPVLAPNTNAVSIWINRDWQEDWYSAEDIQHKYIDRGYTPVFIFYWFADDISPEFVETNREAYLKDLQRFTTFIQQIDGEKLVILNPEFNQNGIGAYAPFNDLLIESMQMVRQAPDTKVSFCVGDFGDYSYVRDLQNWKTFHLSIVRAAQEADFISFQEMRAVTRNSVQGLDQTPYRALEFARYLHETYDKPTFLAYLALSSYGPEGEDVQEAVYKQFSALLPIFKQQADLIGFNSFHLLDVPYHQGYFKEAEKHFGLMDLRGREKGAMEAFRRLNTN